MKTELLQPVLRRAPLEEITMLALEFGRLLMETGASARGVEEISGRVAGGLGAERADVRVGYTSLTISIGIGSDWITRMRKVGPLGVNQRLHHALRTAAAQIERGGFTVTQAQAELERLVRASPLHPDWLVALAVGVACAAFGRLLDVDWAGVGPIFAAAALAQIIRRQLALHKLNVFLSATVVAFLASTLCGLAAEGRPTLGSARAVWVLGILVFTTIGAWLAQDLLGKGR